MMNKIIQTVLILLVMSCGKKAEQSAQSYQPQADAFQTDNTPVPVTDTVALNFIRDYKTFCDTHDQEGIEWVERNPILSTEFKAAYRKLIEDAEQNDPELGLEFDPIFNAQDYPETFAVESSDDDGYVIVKGKDWPEFRTIIKIKATGNDWLVDGAGVVNIPLERQVNLH